MKPNELRVGNLFTTHIPLEGSWAERQRFDKQIYRCEICTFKDEETFKYFTGIRINDLWLKKLGFVKDEIATAYWTKLNYKFCFRGVKMYLVSDIPGEENDSYIIGTPMEFIHEIQNLWYAITGEELAVLRPCPEQPYCVTVKI